MRDSGASLPQVQGIISSIGLLGQAKALYHNQDPAAAADDAVQSAIGKWEFLPNGGARIPRSNADAITDNAQRAVSGLSLAAVQPPARYSPQPPNFDTQHAAGMVKPGNLDPWNRPVLHNPDGSYSTTSSMSIGTDAGETLIPTVVNGQRLTNEDAIAHFHETGENFGVFQTPAQADTFATALHNAQATMFDEHGNPKGRAPGSATAEDWLRVTQASPNWITVGNSIRLMDNAGRFVRRTGGGFVEVPFNVQAIAAAQQASPPPPSPNMP